jgi:NitT/TauT family transport system substrate-binding protein
MKRMKRSAFVARVGSIAVCTGIAAPALSQTLETVNVGSVNSVSDGPFLIADQKGYFRDVGIKVNFINFNSAALMVPSIGTGQIDLGGGAPSAGLYNAIARGIAIKIVADRGSDPPGYGFSDLLVRKDLVTSGKYKSYADLKGMKVAEPAKGASPLCQLVNACAKGGIKYDDLDHVFMSFSDQIVSFRNGSIDAAIGLEPYSSKATQDGFAVRICGADAFYPGEQITTVVYSGNFIEKKPDLAKRWMVAYIRAARFYNDAVRNGHMTGPMAAEAIDIYSAGLKVDKPTLRAMWAASIDPNGRVNVKSLTEDYNIYKQYGLINGNVDMSQVVDMSFADAAAKTLGPYKPARA